MSFLRRPKSKFRAKRTELDGRSFASQFEAAVYALYKLREKAGEIEILGTQEHVYLTDARINYITDYSFLDLKTGEKVHGEAKGFETPEWKLKLRLYRFYGPCRLEIWKGTYIRPVLHEIVIPKAQKPL